MTLSLLTSNKALWQQLCTSCHNAEPDPVDTSRLKLQVTNLESACTASSESLTNYRLCSIQCFIVRVIAHVVSTVAVQIQKAGIEDGASLLL